MYIDLDGNGTYETYDLNDIQGGLDLDENLDYSKIKVKANSKVFSNLQVIKNFEIQKIECNHELDENGQLGSSGGSANLVEYGEITVYTNGVQIEKNWDLEIPLEEMFYPTGNIGVGIDDYLFSGDKKNDVISDYALIDINGNKMDITEPIFLDLVYFTDTGSLYKLNKKVLKILAMSVKTVDTGRAGDETCPKNFTIRIWKRVE